MAIGTEMIAQPYIPILGQLTEWNTVSCSNGCSIDSYNSSGDTLVDGKNYQILDGFHYIQGNFLIREDVTERKVYMKTLVSHTLLDEYPIYDFSLEDGDTTHVYNPISPLPEDGGLFVVDSIVSRPLETGNHRFFYLHAVDPVLSASESTVWVEGVGSLSLINSPSAGPTPNNHLACQSKDGILQYAFIDSVGSCANLAVSENTEAPTFQLYPTVITDQVEVRCSEPRQFNVKVFSMSGQLHYSSDKLRDSVHLISATDLPSGLLVFVIETSQGEWIRLKAVRLKN